MRTAFLLALAFLATLLGCPAASQAPFLKQVNVDVLKPAPDQPEVQASLAKTSLPVGDDLAVSVQVNLPEKALKQCKLGFALYRADGGKPIRVANLAQLRAGSLQILLSTASLAPGDYRLDVGLNSSDHGDGLSPLHTDTPALEPILNNPLASAGCDRRMAASACIGDTVPGIACFGLLALDALARPRADDGYWDRL